MSNDPSPRPGLPRARQPLWNWHPALLAGQGNRVEGRGAAVLLLRLGTVFYGASSENVVRVGRNFRSRGLRIEVAGQGNRIEIGDDVRLTGRIRVHGFGLCVRIGDRSDIKSTRIVAWESHVDIGSDCLIAAGVRMRTSDVHAIQDRSDGTRINPPRDVVVGNHVWIAAEAALLKGSRVPDGCVVGFRSVVTGPVPEADCVVAGCPARIIRRNVSWTR